MTLEIVQGLLHSSPWIVSSKCVEKLREVGEHTVVSYTVLQTLLPGTNMVGHYSDYVPGEPTLITLINVRLQRIREHTALLVSYSEYPKDKPFLLKVV